MNRSENVSDMVVEVDEEGVVSGEGLSIEIPEPMDSQNVDSPLLDGVFTNKEGDDIVPSLSDGVFTNEEVDDIVSPPEIGMNFKTWGDAANDSNGVRCRMTWTFECWGTRDIKKNKERQKISKEMGIKGSSVVEKPKVRKRKSKKCDCKAYLYDGVNVVSRFWEIRNVTLEHTGHTPIPSDSQLVKEYRMQHFTSNMRRRLLDDVEVGIPINPIHDSLARERDGLENMPVTEKDMRHNLKRVVYNSFTAKEFEVHWKVMIIKYGLQKYSWLVELFENRSMWVPAYMRDKFWAGMRTTQRIESIHSFFDKYINSTTKLVEFREKDRKWHRDTVSEYQIEKYFTDIYTDEKYSEYQEQCNRFRHNWVCEQQKLDDENVNYIIRDAIWIYKEGCRSDVLINTGQRFYNVKFNNVTHEGVCDCHMFETHGIMCCHWKKNIDRKHTRIKVCYHDPRRTHEVKRGDNIQNWCDVMIKKACVSNARESVVIDVLKKVLVDLDSTPIIYPRPEDVVHEQNVNGCRSEHIPSTPTVVVGGRIGPVDQEPSQVDGVSPHLAMSQSQSPIVYPSNFHVTQTIRDPVERKKRGRPKKGSRTRSVAEEDVRRSTSKKKKNKKEKPTPPSDNEQSTSEDTEVDEALFRSERKVTRSMRKKTSKKNLAPLLDEELEKLSAYGRFRDLDDTSDES
ncbi:Protein FAR1-RELATED SEQUENCE 5, partial [Bienertia sinuspersici]